MPQSNTYATTSRPPDSDPCNVAMLGGQTCQNRQAMTLRLDAQEHESLKKLAAAEGISMQDAARRAIRDYVYRSEHRSRVSTATDRIRNVHAEAIERLGE
ncbi:MAG: CopG family transcriptional regulator [Microthrixaceae bacterium]|nr:CopG family transcriptional regulator [Microthrixaceae bacterium]